MKDGRSSGWAVTSRPNGAICLDDKVTILAGIGKTMAKRLKEEYDITQVYELATMIADEVNGGHNMLIGSYGVNKVDYWEEQLEGIHDFAPTKLDYRTAENPYKERYGDEWQEKINKTAALSPFTCIAVMVTHIYEEVSAVALFGSI
jgi:hypothetical protein